MATLKFTIEQVRAAVDDIFLPLKYHAYIAEVSEGEFIVEPCTRSVGENRKDFFDGMVMIVSVEGIEVAENMAGGNENEMHIFGKYKNLRCAVKSLIKGNKRKPIEVWT